MNGVDDVRGECGLEFWYGAHGLNCSIHVAGISEAVDINQQYSCGWQEAYALSQANW